MNVDKNLIETIEVGDNSFSVYHEDRTVWIKMNELADVFGLKHPFVWLSSEEGKEQLQKVKDKTGFNYEQLIKVERDKSDLENGTWCSHFHIAATYTGMNTIINCFKEINGKRIPKYSTITDFGLAVGGIYSYEDIKYFIGRESEYLHTKDIIAFFEKMRENFLLTTFFRHPIVKIAGIDKDGAFVCNGEASYPIIVNPTKQDIRKCKRITSNHYTLYKNILYVPKEYIEEMEG